MKRHGHTQREGYVETQGEVGITLPQTKERPRLPANHQKLGKRHERDSHSPRRNQPYQHLDLLTSSLQSYETINSCYFW